MQTNVQITNDIGRTHRDMVFGKFQARKIAIWCFLLSSGLTTFYGAKAILSDDPYVRLFFTSALVFSLYSICEHLSSRRHSKVALMIGWLVIASMSMLTSALGIVELMTGSIK